jgi:hypothetical protein
MCVCTRACLPLSLFPFLCSHTPPRLSLSFSRNCQKFALCFYDFICKESLLLGFITSAKVFASCTRRMNTRTRRSSLFSFCFACVSSNVSSFSSSSSCSQMLSLIPFCCCFHLSSFFTCSLLLSQVLMSASPCSYDDSGSRGGAAAARHKKRRRRQRRRSNRPQQQKNIHARKP